MIATFLSVSVTIGYGVSQFASGIFNITGAHWIMNDRGNFTASAMSGVGRGIKWLSNINMSLSLFLLGFFTMFGATLFVIKALFVGIWDYLVALVPMSVVVWSNDGTSTGEALAGCQGGWTIFYWAWWIAFAPFVVLFLARISRGRSLREYVRGAMIVPSVICFV